MSAERRPSDPDADDDSVPTVQAPVGLAPPRLTRTSSGLRAAVRPAPPSPECDEPTVDIPVDWSERLLAATRPDEEVTPTEPMASERVLAAAPPWPAPAPFSHPLRSPPSDGELVPATAQGLPWLVVALLLVVALVVGLAIGVALGARGLYSV